MSLRDTPKHENGTREPAKAELKTKDLVPIFGAGWWKRGPEPSFQSLRACHSERSEESACRSG